MTWYDEDCIVVDKYLFAGNPVECVVHPDLWNKTKLWDPLGIGENSPTIDFIIQERNISAIAFCKISYQSHLELYFLRIKKKFWDACYKTRAIQYVMRATAGWCLPICGVMFAKLQLKSHVYLLFLQNPNSTELAC